MTPEQKMEAERLQMAYINLFDTDNGRVVLDDLMKAHCMFSPTFEGDVNQALLKEGGRNVVLRILAIIGKTPKVD